MLHSEAQWPKNGMEVPDGATPLKWFSKHPVVSTVLWIFGAQQLQEQGSLPKKHPSNSRLSWSDEHGGQLTHYYNVRDGARVSVQDGVYSSIDKKSSDVSESVVEFEFLRRKR